MCDSHLTCKVADKCLNVHGRVEVVDRNIRWSPPFRCCPVSSQCPWKKTLIERKNFFSPITRIYLIFFSPEMQKILIETRVYYKLCCAVWKETSHKPLKSSSCKNVFLKYMDHWCNLLRPMLFIPCGNWKPSLYKFIVTWWFGQTTLMICSLK